MKGYHQSIAIAFSHTYRDLGKITSDMDFYNSRQGTLDRKVWSKGKKRERGGGREGKRERGEREREREREGRRREGGREVEWGWEGRREGGEGGREGRKEGGR